MKLINEALRQELQSPAQDLYGKTAEDCADRFNNVANFKGQPAGRTAVVEDTDDFETLHVGYDEANRRIVRPDGAAKILDFVAELVVLRTEQLGGPADDYEALYSNVLATIKLGQDIQRDQYAIEDTLWRFLRTLHDELNNRRKWNPILELSPPLAQIVTDVCVRAGIPEDKIDTSELTDVHRNKWDEQLARLRGKLVKRVRDEHPNLRAENERLRADILKLEIQNGSLRQTATSLRGLRHATVNELKDQVAALQAELDRVRRVQRAEAQPVIAPRSGYRWGLLP